ncbi:MULTISPECIES: hypothetical protein [unclassified Streptomyces]
MGVVTPHVARGRRLALALFITATVVPVALLSLLARYLITGLGG